MKIAEAMKYVSQRLITKTNRTRTEEAAIVLMNEIRSRGDDRECLCGQKVCSKKKSKKLKMVWPQDD